ncbi:hypothetical protein B0H10DRAFT_2113592 [Mycena sp. CBHHK59/15]|nr:hypothetical protein B0H10DRAFT_2113592 [Mycena sp. CBHHK59/15]
MATAPPPRPVPSIYLGTARHTRAVPRRLLGTHNATAVARSSSAARNVDRVPTSAARPSLPPSGRARSRPDTHSASSPASTSRHVPARAWRRTPRPRPRRCPWTTPTVARRDRAPTPRVDEHRASELRGCQSAARPPKPPIDQRVSHPRRSRSVTAHVSHPSSLLFSPLRPRIPPCRPRTPRALRPRTPSAASSLHAPRLVLLAPRAKHHSAARRRRSATPARLSSRPP